MIWTQWWSLLFSHLISRSKNILMVINVYILCVYSIYQYSCTIWTCADLPFSRPKNQFFLFLFLVKILKFRWIEGSNFVRIFCSCSVWKRDQRCYFFGEFYQLLFPKHVTTEVFWKIYLSNLIFLCFYVEN